MVDVLAKIDRLLKIVFVSLFISLYVLFNRVSSLFLFPVLSCLASLLHVEFPFLSLSTDFALFLNKSDIELMQKLSSNLCLSDVSI